MTPSEVQRRAARGLVRQAGCSCRRRSGTWAGRTHGRTESPGVGVGLETLDDEPETQPHFKQSTGDQENEADGDPEDLSDGTRRVKHVTNYAQTRQSSGDQPGPEQQQTQEYAPEAQRRLADVVGDGVRLCQE
jgi:hypothetical protein